MKGLVNGAGKGYGSVSWTASTRSVADQVFEAGAPNHRLVSGARIGSFSAFNMRSFAANRLSRFQSVYPTPAAQRGASSRAANPTRGLRRPLVKVLSISLMLAWLNDAFSVAYNHFV